MTEKKQVENQRQWRQRSGFNAAKERQLMRNRARRKNNITDAQQYVRYDTSLRVPLPQVAKMIKKDVWQMNRDKSILYDLGNDVLTTRAEEYENRQDRVRSSHP